MRIITFLAVIFAATIGIAAPASADQVDSTSHYRVLCAQVVTATGPVGPEVCVPIPV